MCPNVVIIKCRIAHQYPDTLRITRAKDVHFFAVIARAYIEENYDQIIRHLCPDGRPLEYAGIAVSLELNGASGVRCENVSGFKTEDDPCPFTAVVQYEQSDGSHARVCLLTPRAAPWRRSSAFLTIMDMFYGAHPLSLRDHPLTRRALDPPGDFTDQ